MQFKSNKPQTIIKINNVYQFQIHNTGARAGKFLLTLSGL